MAPVEEELEDKEGSAAPPEIAFPQLPEMPMLPAMDDVFAVAETETPPQLPDIPADPEINIETQLSSSQPALPFDMP